MPKLSGKTSVTATTEVALSPTLKVKLEKLITRYKKRAKEIDDLEALQDADADELENSFAEAGEYNTLLAGVKIGDIPVKRIEGQTYKKLDKEGLMKRFKISPAQWDSFNKELPKKGHLSISLPKKKKEDA